MARLHGQPLGERLEQALEGSDRGVVVQDATGAIVAANDAACTMLGLDWRQLLGLMSTDPRWAAIDESGFPLAGERHPAMVTLETGRDQRGRVMGVVVPLPSDGGTMTRWLSVDTRAVRTDGEITHVVAEFSDITLDPAGVDASSRALEEYRLLAQAVTDVVMQVDTRWRVVWSSPTEPLLGRNAGDVRGCRMQDLLHDPDRGDIAKDLQRSAEQGGPDVVELVRRANGAPRWVSFRARRIGRGSSGFTVALTDVHERTIRELELAASEEVFRSVLMGASIGMAVTDLSGRVVMVNSALCDMLGRDESWLIGRLPHDWVHPADIRRVEASLATLRRGEDDHDDRPVRYVRRDGSLVWTRRSAVAITEPSTGARRIVVQVVDVTAEIEAQKRLQYQSSHDPLTGLRNREWIVDILESDLRTTARTGRHVAVLMADVRSLHTVNESLGHGAGDAVLVEVGRRLRDCVGAAGRVGRFGADHFVVVALDLESADDIEELAERLSSKVRRPVSLPGASWTPTLALGVAVSTPTSTVETILRNADAALLEAKRRTSGRWVAFEDGMADQALRELTLESDLQSALESGQLAVAYQPIVSLESGETTGYEALVRWPHPTRGQVSPAEFIPLAESSGLIVPLGAHVLDLVCQALAGPRDLLRLPVSVNVSAVELAEADWSRRFLEILERYGVDPGRIVVEVTETAAVSAYGAARAHLSTLRERGAGVHIDDFGTGFSSISLLADLPVTGVKLDARFVSGLDRNDHRATALASGLAGLVHGLGLDGIAEGVETERQARVLREQGWRHAQGYLFGRPQLLAHDG